MAGDGHDCRRAQHLDYRSRKAAGPRVRLPSVGVRSSNYSEAAPSSYCCRKRKIARPMDVLVHAGKPDEPRAPIRDGTDDASQSRMPQVGFARERRGHREARSGMPRRERHEWSIAIMKAAAKLKVLRVAIVHGRERSAGEPLAQTINAGCKENRFRHVKRGTCQPRHSCDAAGRIKTGANDKWTRPAEEREIARGVLQIVASLKALLLEFPGSPGVEGRYGHGCQHGDRAGHGVTFRQPGTGRDGAIPLRILRAKTGHNGSGGEHRAGGKERTQERAEIH